MLEQVREKVMGKVFDWRAFTGLACSLIVIILIRLLATCNHSSILLHQKGSTLVKS
jgi:hypothetical protein